MSELLTDYDKLNAKNAAKVIAGTEDLDLRDRLIEHERAHKNRVSVLKVVAAPEPNIVGPADSESALEANPEGVTRRVVEIVEEREPITRIVRNRGVPGGGTWWCPFSGYSQPLNVEVCPASGAKREGDEAVRQVEREVVG